LDHLAADVAIARALTIDRKLRANPQSVTVKEVPDIHCLQWGSAFRQEAVASTGRASQQDPWSPTRQEDLPCFQDRCFA
jgi:hypothetical protein